MVRKSPESPLRQSQISRRFTDVSTTSIAAIQGPLSTNTDSSMGHESEEPEREIVEYICENCNWEYQTIE